MTALGTCHYDARVMKKGSRFTFPRFICAILGACYGILAVIATAPHPHDRSKLSTEANDGRGVVSAAFTPASATPPAKQAVSGPCRLCGWGRSSARLCPVSTHRAGTETTASSNSGSVTRVTDDLPAGNVLLRAPPAI